MPGHPHGLRLLVDEAFFLVHVALTVTIKSDTLPNICDLIARGMIRIDVPSSAVRPDHQEGRMVAQKRTDFMIGVLAAIYVRGGSGDTRHQETLAQMDA